MHRGCFPVHTHSLPLSSLVTTRSILNTTSSVSGVLVEVTVVNPVHSQTREANGLPPDILQVSVILLPSIIGLFGNCVINGDDVGTSIKQN